MADMFGCFILWQRVHWCLINKSSPRGLESPPKPTLCFKTKPLFIPLGITCQNTAEPKVPPYQFPWQQGWWHWQICLWCGVEIHLRFRWNTFIYFFICKKCKHMNVWIGMSAMIKRKSKHTLYQKKIINKKYHNKTRTKVT